MPAAITTLRGTLATDLANAGVWSTFAYPPATLLANSVVITPSDPYIVPSNNEQVGVSPLANFKILITSPAFDNQGSLQDIEETMIAVFNKLANSAIVFSVTSFSAPSIMSLASGDLLTAELQITVLTTWE